MRRGVHLRAPPPRRRHLRGRARQPDVSGHFGQRNLPLPAPGHSDRLFDRPPPVPRLGSRNGGPTPELSARCTYFRTPFTAPAATSWPPAPVELAPLRSLRSCNRTACWPPRPTTCR